MTYQNTPIKGPRCSNAKQMADLYPPQAPFDCVFEKGIPGFVNLKVFTVCDLDDGAYPPLKLMVSKDNPAISFILYPHVNDTSMYQDDFLAEISRVETNGDVMANPKVYTIVTIRQNTDEESKKLNVTLTTNLQAPLVIDDGSQKGLQKIYTRSGLSMSFPLKRFNPEKV